MTPITASETPIVAGEADGALDQQVRPADDAAKADGERAEHHPDGLVRLRFLHLGRAVAAPGPPVGDHGEGREADQQQHAVEQAQASGQGEPEEEQRHAHDRVALETDFARLDRQRIDAGRRAQDQEQVADIAADDVADGDAGRAPERRLQADEQLRHGGAVGDHGEPDDERRDAEPRGKLHRPPHQELRPAQKKHEAAEQLQVDHEGSDRVTGRGRPTAYVKLSAWREIRFRSLRRLSKRL